MRSYTLKGEPNRFRGMWDPSLHTHTHTNKHTDTDHVTFIYGLTIDQVNHRIEMLIG